jgi:hypothetical protein
MHGNTVFQGIRVLADDEEAPDPPLTPHQRKLVKALTPAQIRAIDLALLANISPHWRNVARVVAATMLDVENRAGGIPDVFYAERVKVLAERGTIEAQGDMNRMRLLEVRFAMRSATANPLKPGSLIDLDNLDASKAVIRSADVEFIDVFSADAGTGQESSVQASGADSSSAAGELVVSGGSDVSDARSTEVSDVASGTSSADATATAAAPDATTDEALSTDAPGTHTTSSDVTSTPSTDETSVHVSDAEVTNAELCSTSESVETVKSD